MDPNIKPNTPAEIGAPGAAPAGSPPQGTPPPQPLVGGRQVAVPQDIYPVAPETPRLEPGEMALGPQTPAKPPKKRREGLKSILSTVGLLILAPLIALAITAFAFQSYQVEGASMETTLSNNDRLIVNKTSRSWARITDGSYLPKRGDIIIFNQAGLYDSSGNQQKQLIKRVIALPDERVVVKDGRVTVYNSTHPDGYSPDQSGEYPITVSTTNGDIDVVVGADSVFVLGDNRGNSEDSRSFGPVKTDDIVGKLTLRIAPFDKFQKF